MTFEPSDRENSRLRNSPMSTTGLVTLRSTSTNPTASAMNNTCMGMW